MLKVELTDNYAGFNILGDYDDFDKLYDAINYMLRINDDEIKDENTMKEHIYGLMYDIRHAYQGERDIELVGNHLNEYVKELFELEEVSCNNVYYSFYYIVPELILDIILIKYFINKLDSNSNNVYNKYINTVNLFFSLVIDSLDDILNKESFNDLKKNLLNASVINGQFVCQWFELVTIDYVNMNKTSRKKEFMKIMDKIYNHICYDDYFELKHNIEKTAKKKKIPQSELHYDYPIDINW